MKNQKTIVTVAIIAVIAVGFLAANLMGVRLKAEDTQLTVSALFFHHTVSYSDIAAVTLQTNVAYGKRTFGADFIGVRSGTYQNEAYGSYTCAVAAGQPEALVIQKADGSYLVCNTADTEALHAVAKTLRQKTGKA